MLGDLKLADCLKPVFIPSYDINNNEAILFKTRHGIKFPENNARLFDVCRATSAAPTYLPAYAFNYENKDRLSIDGGVYMNNPSVGAIVEVSRYSSEYNFPDLAFENIYCLSLGTGHYSDNILKNKIAKGGGELDWVAPISDIMMQGVNTTTCYECNELLENDNFLRLSITIEDESCADLADSSAKTMDYLTKKVQTDILTNAVTSSAIDKFILDAGL
jgi:patatin-like phospholipase/acyl hydrolase